MEEWTLFKFYFRLIKVTKTQAHKKMKANINKCYNST